MSNLFGKAFFRVLNEEDNLAIDQMSDEQAMQATYDAGTDPQAMDDVHQGTRDAAIAAAKSHNLMVAKLDEWKLKIDEFINFINGDGENNILGNLARADSTTIFGKLKKKVSTQIGMVASDLASLGQSLQTAKQDANNPEYKGS